MVPIGKGADDSHVGDMVLEDFVSLSSIALQIYQTDATSGGMRYYLVFHYSTLLQTSVGEYIQYSVKLEKPLLPSQ